MSGWSESVHPRVPMGSSTGGRFASKYKYPPTEETGEQQLTNDEVREFTSQWGKDLDRDDIAELAGAQPGSRVTVGHADPDMGGPDSLGVHIEFMGEDGFPIGRATRYIGPTSIYNHEIEFDAGFKKQGRGLKVFGQQVDAAISNGYDSIETQAAGSYSHREWQNGYYTWARMGYDGVIPNGYGPGGEKTVHEVMARPDGAAWWLKNGEGFQGTFLLHEGSTSRRVFEEYRRMKSKV